MKHVLLYVVLIGGAILAVVGILRAGEHLEAPRSVSGAWTIEGPLLTAPAGDCLAGWIGSQRPRLVVSQSGRLLEALLQGSRGMPLKGTIVEGEMTLTSRASRALPDLQAGVVALHADLDLSAGTVRMIGTVDTGCGPAAAFVAQRQTEGEG
jgi:hypothetical protein